MAKEVVGDIFEHVGVLVHQCYCVDNGGRAAGLAAAVRAIGADPYPPGARAAGAVRYEPVAHPHLAGVAHLYAQRLPGGPTAGDTAAQREAAFPICLEKLRAHDGVDTWLFPRGIGCGLARGSWPRYRSMIHAFAARTEARVLIVRRRSR